MNLLSGSLKPAQHLMNEFRKKEQQIKQESL